MVTLKIILSYHRHLTLKGSLKQAALTIHMLIFFFLKCRHYCFYGSVGPLLKVNSNMYVPTLLRCWDHRIAKLHVTLMLKNSTLVTEESLQGCYVFLSQWCHLVGITKTSGVRSIVDVKEMICWKKIMQIKETECEKKKKLWKEHIWSFNMFMDQEWFILSCAN